MLFLIRGLPGSGKSTIARELVKFGFVHCEADDFFINDGVYQFDMYKLGYAHDACIAKAEQALFDKRNCVVANTFTQQWEMEPYRKMAETFGVRLFIATANGNYPNVHNVPADAIERMKARWED